MKPKIVHESELPKSLTLKNCQSIRESDFSSINNNKFLYGDFDCDTIPNLDDPSPMSQIPDKKQLYELRFTDELQSLDNITKDTKNKLDDFVKVLHQDPEIDQFNIEYRVKTIPSIVNKLRRKLLVKITDLSGTRITVNDKHDIDRIKPKLENIFKNNIVKEEDFYSNPNPNNPYRAIHFDLIYNGTPIELQLKTKRIHAITQPFHTIYKNCDNIPKEAQPNFCKTAFKKFNSLIELALKADDGNKSAIKKFDKLIITENTFIKKNISN